MSWFDQIAEKEARGCASTAWVAERNAIAARVEATRVRLMASPEWIAYARAFRELATFDAGNPDDLADLLSQLQEASRG